MSSTARTWVSKYRLLADTEAREDPSQQVVAGELPGDFVECLLRRPQLLRDQLAGAVLLELAAGFLGVLARASERVEVPLTCRHRGAIECLIAHAQLEMRAQRLQPLASQGRHHDPRRSGDRVGDR